MNANAIIDAVMNYTDDVVPGDFDNLQRRAKILQLLQETYDEVWLDREWGFSYRRLDSLSFTAGVGSLPGDFLELGVQGGIYIRETRTALVENFYQDIMDARELTQDTGPASRFMIAAESIYTNSISSTEAYVVWYRTTAQSLNGDSDLLPIPVGYHNTVLLQGTLWRSRRNKGDARDFESSYRMALSRMKAVERGRKSSVQRLPLQTGNW